MQADFFDIEPGNEKVKKKDLLYRVSAFRYHNKLKELMQKKVFTLGRDASVQEAAQEMSRRKISSVIIIDQEKNPIGIATERDLVRSIVAKNSGLFSKIKISEIMTANPITLEENDTLYDALSVFSKYEIKHLPITLNGKITGIISFRQMVKIRNYDPLVLIGHLEDAHDAKEIRKLREDLVHTVHDRLIANVDPVEIISMISLVNTSIHRYLFNWALENIGKRPPADFSLFVTGSHGRQENLLFPDQDFGFILEDYDDKYYAEFDAYFIKLAQNFSDNLQQAGFPYCQGYVMGQYPTWRKRLFEWKLHLKYIFEGMTGESIRYTTLIFDSQHLLGERSIFNNFKDYAFEKLQSHHNIIGSMHFEEEASHRAPLSIFRTFITEKSKEHRGEIDMKKSGLIFIIEALRILALKYNIKETASLDRLHALVDKGTVNADDAEYFENSYKLILEYALRAQVTNYLESGSFNYYLNPNNLSPQKKIMLKSAFLAIGRLQDIVSGEFGGLII